jgi:hypothetical protein
MSNDEINTQKEIQDNLLKAILRFLKDIFKGGKGATKPLPAEHLVSDNDLPVTLANNPIAKQMVEMHNDSIKLVSDFARDNWDQLSSAIEQNKLSEVGELVKSQLIPNINTYLDTIEIPDEVMSNPLRRIPEYRDSIVDRIDEVFDRELSASGGLRNIINNNFKSTLSEPSLSHSEEIGLSPREENIVEISKEVELEMNSKVPTIK